MQPSTERFVNEYARLRKEAFRLRRLIEETPALRHEFEVFASESSEKCQENSPAGRLKSDLVVATIMDEFSSDNWSPEFANIMLSFDNWEREIDYFQPDFLFVESAWRGNYSQWSYALEAPRIHSNARAFDRLIAHCKKRGIPIVFWNKEDPLHFDKFLEAARLCDLVFTTDAGSVARYKKEFGHAHVYALAFAAQPFLCNPVRQDTSPPGRHMDEFADQEDSNEETLNRYRQEKQPFFAGSYYTTDHGSRTQQMDMVFDVLLELGGVIYDRSYHSDSADVQMPDKYLPICKPPVPFDEIVSVYKRHACALNVNSITSSSTMMSRRVFEVLACATPVVSTESEAIKGMLSDAVDLVTSRKETFDRLSEYSNNADAAARKGHLGHRIVLREHTYNHRLSDIAVALDQAIEGGQFTSRVRPLESGHPITLLLPIMDLQSAKGTLQSLTRQSHCDFELMIFLEPACDRDEIDQLRKAASKSRVQIFSVPERARFGETVRRALKDANGEMAVYLRECDQYGPEFLADIILPLRYTEADIIGKQSHFAFSKGDDETRLLQPEFAHRYVNGFDTGPILFTKRAIDRLDGNIVPVALEGVAPCDDVFRRAGELGLRMYSCDWFNVLEECATCERPHRFIGQGKQIGDVFI